MKPLLFVGLISSGTTRVAFAGSPAYASIKGALEALTRYLAPGLGSRGIAAKVVAPGAVFGGGAMPDSPEIHAYVVQITALGRVAGPDDIGRHRRFPLHRYRSSTASAWKQRAG